VHGLRIGWAVHLWLIANWEWVVAAISLFKEENGTSNNLFGKAPWWHIIICFLAAEQ
jgi:hypothetical protein